MKNSTQAAHSLIANGYCYLPKLIGEHFLHHLRQEADYIINAHPYRYDNSHDQAVRIGQIQRPRVLLNVNKFLYTTRFFFNPFFLKTISKAFNVSPFHIAFNRQLISQQTFPSNNPPSNVLHWDRLRSIKTWVYLTETPYDAGPIKIIPNTHITNKMTRVLSLESLNRTGGLYDSIDNRSTILSDENSESYLPRSFSAGDVLMFDTDVSHGARKVSEGYSRFIYRAYSSLNSDLRLRSACLKNVQYEN